MQGNSNGPYYKRKAKRIRNEPTFLYYSSNAFLLYLLYQKPVSCHDKLVSYSIIPYILLLLHLLSYFHAQRLRLICQPSLKSSLVLHCLFTFFLKDILLCSVHKTPARYILHFLHPSDIKFKFLHSQQDPLTRFLLCACKDRQPNLHVILHHVFSSGVSILFLT